MFECPPAEVVKLLDGVLDVEKLTSDQKYVSETRKLAGHLQNGFQSSLNEDAVFHIERTHFPST